MTNQTRHYALSDKDNWMTPPETVADLNDALDGIDLDPCAGATTDIGDIANYRLEDDQDGLKLPWFGTVFVNPPFSYKKDWLEKVETEIQAGRVETVVVLTPDGTDTISWWHEYIAENAEYICFREGRLDYVDPAGSDGPGATFGTAFSVYGEVPQDLIDTLEKKGHLMKTV